MYNEQQTTQAVSATSIEDEKSADMMVNNLEYSQPKALSLATNRNLQKSFFQRSQYDGSRSTTMIVDINSGTSFVNCANSYLALSIKLKGAVGATGSFGSGSAMNVINTVRVKSRSGVELSRVQSANRWSLFNSVYHRSAQNLDTVGVLEGFTNGRNPAITTVIDSSSKKFLIPLACLSPYFSPMDGQLMPPQLASGLRIELDLEDYRTSLYQIGLDAVTGYEITDCYIQLDSTELTDETQRAINMDSAKDGLEWATDQVYTTLTQIPANQLTTSVQVRKAVSQACYAYSIMTSTADKNDVTKDSLVAVPFNCDSFTYRLGSLYFPQQRIEAAADGTECCMIAYETFDKLRNTFHETSVDLIDFRNKFGILAASLERDQSLQFSGLAVNNSRTLELDAQFVAVPEGQEIVTFLVYCGVVRAWIDNTSIAV